MILTTCPFASFRISNRMFAKPLTPTLEAVSRPGAGLSALTLPGTVAAVVAAGMPRPSEIVLFEGSAVSGAKACSKRCRDCFGPCFVFTPSNTIPIMVSGCNGVAGSTNETCPGKVLPLLSRASYPALRLP